MQTPVHFKTRIYYGRVGRGDAQLGGSGEAGRSMTERRPHQQAAAKHSGWAPSSSSPWAAEVRKELSSLTEHPSVARPLWWQLEGHGTATAHGLRND